MPSLDRASIEAELRQCSDPHTGRGLLTCASLSALEVSGNTATVHIELAYPAATVADSMAAEIAQQLSAQFGEYQFEVRFSYSVSTAKGQNNLEAMEGVRNVIAVASGKGGVGKSTTSVNLALSLAREGAKVGVLDADIYGPSLQLMLGVEDDVRPKQHGMNFIQPITAHGLQTMSMAYLVTDKTPMVWRGPMASGALMQMMTQTYWQDLDYLIIDMPPGTGDIQLTLAQKIPLAGAVIVTTPQDLALLDARKGVEMFAKVDVPVLGVIENMAVHICSECGHQEHLFGEGGGEALANEYGVGKLGALPLSLAIREQSDAGLPVVAANPESAEAALYAEAARNVAAQLALRNQESSGAFPNITIKHD